MKQEYYYLLQFLILSIAITICFVSLMLLWAYFSHPFTDITYNLNITMDNNSLEAFKSINWSALQK